MIRLRRLAAAGAMGPGSGDLSSFVQAGIRCAAKATPPYACGFWMWKQTSGCEYDARNTDYDKHQVLFCRQQDIELHTQSLNLVGIKAKKANGSELWRTLSLHT